LTFFPSTFVALFLTYPPSNCRYVKIQKFDFWGHL
jgi:hypothetical protein